MKKKIFLFALLVYIFVAAFALVACTPTDPPVTHTHSFAESWQYNSTEHWHAATCGHSSERDSVAPHDINSDGKCTVCDYETAPAPEKMTFEQLVADHKEELNEFVTEAIAPSVLANKEILSESRYVASAEDGNLGTVSLLYIYKNDETVRTMELAEVTLTSTVTNVDIANGTFATPAVSVEKTEVFQFDAKENFEKQDVAELLYKAAKCESAEVKLFRELEADSVRIRSFAILVQSDGFVRIKNVNVEVTDDTDEALKTNLADSNKYDAHVAVSEVALKGTNILAGDYRLEEFDVTPDDPDIPSAITDKQLIAALEQYCKDDFLDKSATKEVIEMIYGSFDKNKMSDENWYINEDEEGKITAIEYSFFFKANATHGNFVICYMTFNTPCSQENLVKGNLPTATYKMNEEYSLSYNPSIQTERSALANAILTACKGAPADNNSTVILVDNGSTVDGSLGGDGHVCQFNVVEISESGATEYKVKIRSAKSLDQKEADAEYMQYIADGYWAQTATPREYKITGRRLVAEESDTKIDKQILDALESNYMQGIMKKTLIGQTINTENVTNINWYLEDNNGDDLIEKVYFSCYYERTKTSAYYLVGSATFDTSISREDLIKGDVLNVTYAKEYVLNYDPSIQAERSELANAILTACKGAPVAEGSNVILVDNRTTTNAQFGTVGRFTVVEVNESGATEYQVQIKYAESDKQYIQEVADGNYVQTKTAAEHSVTGDKLTVEEETSSVAKEIANINGAFRDET